MYVDAGATTTATTTTGTTTTPRLTSLKQFCQFLCNQTRHSTSPKMAEDVFKYFDDVVGGGISQGGIATHEFRK